MSRPLNHNDFSANTIVALPADLMFGARIRATAEAVAGQVLLARSADEVLNGVAGGARRVLLDLEHRGVDAVRLIEQLRAEHGRDIHILTYSSHTNVDRMRAAREAGADRVVARSAFVQQLPQLLRGE